MSNESSRPKGGGGGGGGGGLFGSLFKRTTLERDLDRRKGSEALMGPWDQDSLRSIQDPDEYARKEKRRLEIGAEEFRREQREERYRRRVTRSDLPGGRPPTRFQRGTQVVGAGLSLIAGIFMVFYMDFGEEDHVYTPLRRYFGTQNRQVNLWPTQVSESWIDKTGFSREELEKMVGEAELQSAAPDTRKREQIYLDTIRQQAQQQQQRGGGGADEPANAPVNANAGAPTTPPTPTPIAEQTKGTIWNRGKA